MGWVQGLRNIVSSALNINESLSYHRFFRQRISFFVRGCNTGTGMAVGSADKPTTTELRNSSSGSDRPSPRTFRWNTGSPMAPMSSDDHLKMVEKLQTAAFLLSEQCVRAMQMVDRKHFVLPDIPKSVVYKDIPLLNSPYSEARPEESDSSHGGGRGLTISAPHMHAIALELLSQQLQPGARVLDVGSGSGYLTACFSCATQPGSYVLGVEKFEEVALNSIHNLNHYDERLLAEGAVEICVGNIYDIVGRLPASQEALFHAIHVGAAAPAIPADLESLLAPGGRLVIPVDPQRTSGHPPGDTGPPSTEHQVLYVVDRAMHDDDMGRAVLRRREVGGVRFVPLTLPEEQH